MSAPRGDLIPSLGLAIGAAFWGLYWIPIRGIEAAGVHAFWTGPVIFGSSTLLFLPYLLARWRVFAGQWRSIVLPGLLAGSAFALYIVSLNQTDVVRAILLFYMSPLWSTLLGILILNERLTINRLLALVLAAAGLYVVLVVESGLPVPRNTGDWYALISGLCWAVASVKLFQDGARHVVEKVSMFVLFALFLSLALIFWQQGDLHGAPGFAVLAKSWYWILLVAIGMAPICYLTIWPATVLSPGRVGMLLLVEVIVGVGSAAWLSGDPFGWRELAGTVLILAAGLVEVMRRQIIVEPDK